MADSTVTLIGNLTRDLELRYTTGGRAVANGSIAVSRRWKQNDEWQEETSFFNLVLWSDLAENACASLPKGSRIMCTGRLEQRSYETREGEKRSTVEVVVDAIGPELRWATCEVERISRNEGGSSQRRQQPNPVHGDEEPF